MPKIILKLLLTYTGLWDILLSSEYAVEELNCINKHGSGIPSSFLWHVNNVCVSLTFLVYPYVVC